MTIKSISKKFAAILTFALVLSVLTPTAAQAVGSATLTGYVYSSASTSVPIENVYVSGGGAWASTAADGRFTLTGLNPGAVSLMFSPNNEVDKYFSKNTSVNVVEGENSLNFMLKPYPVGSQTLSGRIVDENGEPLSGVNIFLSTGNWPENAYFSGSTSSEAGFEGEFSFSNLPAGKYWIWLSTPSTWDSSTNSPISTHYSRNLNISLPSNGLPVEWRLISKSTSALTGKVISEDDREVYYPNAWLSACVFVTDQNVCEYTSTNADGDYSVYLPAGTVKIAANSSNEGLKFHYSTKTTTMGSANTGFDVLVKPYPVGTLAISGTVYDEFGSNPIAYANVQLSGSVNSDWVSYSTTTDEFGTYRFEKLFKGTYQMTASEFGYNPPSPKNVSLTNADKTDVDLALQLRGTEVITGVVLSPEGFPIEGAGVSASQKGRFSNFAPPTTTDADGIFTLTNLNSDTDYAITASASDYLTSRTTISRTGQDPITLSLTPYRTGTTTVSGILEDSTGTPLSGQQVQLALGGYSNSQQEQNYSTATDTNGRYSFANLPSGSARLFSDLPGFTSCEQFVFISGADNKTVDCKFYESSATITVLYTSSTGAVLNSQYSPQISWTDGAGTNWNEWRPLYGVVNDDGSVKFENAPRAENLKFKSDMWPTSNSEYLAYGAVPTFTLNTLADPPTQKIVVQSTGTGSSSVTGQVRDSSGQALPGVVVDWSSDAQRYSTENSYMAGRVTSDANGFYTISNLKPGKTLMISFEPSNQTESAYQATAGANYTEIYGTTIPGEPSTRVRNLVIKYGSSPVNEIDSSSSTGSYTVRLVDSLGNPIAGVEANLSGFVGSTSTSDGDGKVTFSDLPVGSYYFSVMSDGSSGYISSYMETGVQVTANQLDVVDTDYVLQPAPITEGSISGMMLDSDSQQAVTGYECQANLNQLDDMNIHNYWLSSDCLVDASGAWTVKNLAAGEYTIRFSPAGTNLGISQASDFQAQFEYPDPIVVHSDGLNLTSLPANYLTSFSKLTDSSVVVSIYDASTRLPISRELVCSLTSPSVFGISNQDVKSDTAGKITLTNLVVGKTYNLNCGGSSQIKLMAEPGTKFAKAYFDNVDTGSRLSGRVIDEQGDPVEGVVVGASNSSETLMCLCSGAQDTNRLTSDVTDADGNYYLENLGGWVAFVGVNDPSGTYGITQVATTVASNSSGNRNFVLKPGAKVTGVITDMDGRALKVQTGVGLESIGPESEKYLAWTDYSGATAKYSFDRAVSAGQYRISVRSWTNGTLNYAAGYLQADGTVGVSRASATVVTIDPLLATNVVLPQIRVSGGGYISGQVSFQSSTGSSLGSEWATGLIDLYYLDGSTWTKSSVIQGGVHSGNNGRFSLDGLLPGTYKLGFNDGAIGLFKPSYANGASSLDDAATFTVVEGQTTTGATGILRYQPPINSAQFLTLTSLSDAQKTVLREAISISQVGKSVRVKAPEDMVGQYVAASRFARGASASDLRAAAIGKASAEAGVTTWLAVDSDGFVNIPEEYIGTTDQTFVFVNGKNVAVGIADIAGYKPYVAPPAPPVVVPTVPQLTAQAPATSVPSTFKAGKKLVLKAKTNMGSAVKVTAKGCKVSPTYKTTISYKTKKVGKRTIRTRVTTKTLISYSVTMGRKGSTCTVTQKSPATTTLAAMTNVTAIRVR